MCGIIGIFGQESASKYAAEGLKIIENRGKDSFGVFDGKKVFFEKQLNQLNNKIKNNTSNNCLAHNLHSIVNFVPQPIKGKQGILAANCEIYNWKELNEKYKLKAKNDSELLLNLIETKGIKKIKEILKEIRGVYSFAYWTNNEIIIARDIIGVKPLWYFNDKNTFAFSSERKVLVNNNFIKNDDIEELNPRTILIYNIKTKTLKKIKRNFFKTTPQIKKTKEKIKAELKKEIIEAIKIRIPEKQKFGILFSGGIDSTTIAQISKNLDKNFTCYSAVLEEPGMEPAKDYIAAQKVAKKLGFKLKVKKIKLKDVERYLKKIVPLIEDNNVVKVGVALTFYVACELAKKDNIKVIFSGLGAEELFAGYQRHENSTDINKECLKGFIEIYERDTYRDDVITMNNNLELRVPFMDKNLIDHCLKIPSELKLKKERGDWRNKIILREIAKDLGIPEEFAERKKVAAQYGSKFDRAIQKLAKKQHQKKSEYLKQFYNKGNVPLGVLFSGGKDSVYAMHTMIKQNYDIKCLITMKSINPDSYMFHTPNINLAELQAKAMDLPIIEQSTHGRKEEELKDMEKAIKKAMKEYQIKGIVTGALYSNYQRERVQKICDKLGLKTFSPLWHIDQELEMRSLVKQGFEVIISSIAADGLSKEDLGKTIDNKFIDRIVKLNKKNQINIAGEGGEFETLVLNCPLFNKKIKTEKAQIVMENQCTGRYIIKKASLMNK
ncbi:diphthine--ammonia ligase [Nanoarchaeota archaeon]